jgi:two-component system OmpR family sensor kinase
MAPQAALRIHGKAHRALDRAAQAPGSRGGRQLQLERAHAARAVAVGRLTAGIERATRLVEQLLVLARQEAAEAKLEPVNLTDLVRRTLGDMANAAATREIDLGLHQADEAEVRGQGDALLVLLRNLVDNALKYTPAGGTVDVSVRAGEGGATLVVEDSGPGISPEERERVFNRFYRVPGSTATGSGLGLAIIKAIAERHGATLTLDQSSRLGGLLVQVAFPAAPMTTAGKPGAKAPAA